MPKSHLGLWKHLYKELQNELVVAGSFAAAQMRHNKLGSTSTYNDIDFWYNEDHDKLITETELQGLISKINIIPFFLLLQPYFILFS